MRALLIATYEMGRQPFGLASPAAWLRNAGVEVTCVDLARERLRDDSVTQAQLVAFFLPMHMATRLAVPVIRKIRSLNPSAHLCGYGLYAMLNESLLRDLGAHSVLGAEFESDLEALAIALREGTPPPQPIADTALPHLAFKVPDRRGLPPPTSYATLHDSTGSTRCVGYTEASRGCKHTCRHCPIVPVYKGRFRVVPINIVLADIGNQVEMGVRHITFGDPDFFNGPVHAIEVVQRLADTYPDLTYDVTIKIEHLLTHAKYLATLRDTGCAFVTSAVESFDNHVLEILNKGHTSQDIARAAATCRTAGLVLTPTFVAFTPWTTLESYCAYLQAIASLDLVDAVAPIQLAIRLLLPEGSSLLTHKEVAEVVGEFDKNMLSYSWCHADPRVDALQAEVIALVGQHGTASRRAIFEEIWTLAHERAALHCPLLARNIQARVAIPYLNEPWYC